MIVTLITNAIFIYICYRVFRYFAHESPDAQERQRTQTPLSFDDGVSYERFCEMARNANRRYEVESVTADRDGVVKVKWHSNTAKTQYEAFIDFNDWGHLTGRYWKRKTGGCEMDVIHEIERYFSGCIYHESRAVPAV